MSRADPLAALRAELGTSPPASLAAVPPDVLDALVVAIRDARERHGAELEGAAERALHLVPSVLRGTVKRIVFT